MVSTRVELSKKRARPGDSASLGLKKPTSRRRQQDRLCLPDITRCQHLPARRLRPSPAVQRQRTRWREGGGDRSALDKYPWQSKNESMSPTPKQIGRRLKMLRDARALSRATLAELAGISREYVRNLEAGEYNVTMATLQKLAKALGVPVRELLG